MACSSGSEDAASDTSTTDGPTAGTTDAQTDPSPSETASGGPDDSTGTVDTDPTDPEPTADAAEAFLAAMPGLWVAPVTSWTSAGSFPTMNMDVRAADPRVLFARVDLDPDNSLRFAFALEEHGNGPELVFRNGGEFLGIARDTRTTLHSADPQAGSWRFCGLGSGCDYVDARFVFSGPDAMQLDVDVMGTRHIEWAAVRRETRALEADFPASGTVPPDAPFPDMPTLQVEVSWTEALLADADVWIVLTTTECGLDPVTNCVPSRYLSAEVPAGATSTLVELEQVHAGAYQTNVILDRNRNLGASLLPDSGDAVSLPDTATTVPMVGVGEVMVRADFEI